MLRKTIQFTDLEGNEVAEDHYFSLTKAEIVKLEVSVEGGLQEKLIAIAKTSDAKLILKTFDEILKASYGRRENNRFVKREADWEEFVAGEAYSSLFMELVTNAAYAAEFVKGILPADMETQQVIEDLVELPQPALEGSEAIDTEDNRPAWLQEGRDPSHTELQRMSKDELMLAMQVKMGRSGG